MDEEMKKDDMFTSVDDDPARVKDFFEFKKIMSEITTG